MTNMEIVLLLVALTTIIQGLEIAFLKKAIAALKQSFDVEDEEENPDESK